MQVHQIVWNKSNENTIVLRRQSCISDLCKYKSEICVHEKHVGYYTLPILGNPPAREKPIILLNILTAPEEKAQPEVCDKSPMLDRVIIDTDVL